MPKKEKNPQILSKNRGMNTNVVKLLQNECKYRQTTTKETQISLKYLKKTSNCVERSHNLQISSKGRYKHKFCQKVARRRIFCQKIVKKHEFC